MLVKVVTVCSQVDPIRCFPKPCAIGPFYQPSIPESMMFYAMAAFSYPIDAYGISNEDNIVSPQEFINGAYNYCRTVSIRENNLTCASAQILVD